MCNAAFVSMLGFDSAQDVIGRKLHDVIHHSHGNGTRYNVSDCPIYNCAQRGVAAHVENEYFIARDGHRIPVEYRVIPNVEGVICTFIERRNETVSGRRPETSLRWGTWARADGQAQTPRGQKYWGGTPTKS